VRDNGLEPFLVTLRCNSSTPERLDQQKLEGNLQPAGPSQDESWTLDRGLSASGRAGRRFGTSRSRGRSWQRLDAMPEEDGSVLDHSCLMFISNMGSGTKHDNR
jgi:hypothetical protein